MPPHSPTDKHLCTAGACWDTSPLPLPLPRTSISRFDPYPLAVVYANRTQVRGSTKRVLSSCSWFNPKHRLRMSDAQLRARPD